VTPLHRLETTVNTLRIKLALAALLVFNWATAFGVADTAKNAPSGAGNQAAVQTLPMKGAPTCLAIPDDAYDGTIGSMACVGFANEFGGVVDDVDVSFGIDHSFVGDLVLKVIDPTGQRLATVMSRPGLNETVDDGSGCCGNSADITSSGVVTFDDQVAGPTAESMGNPGSTVCTSDGLCSYVSNSGAAAAGLSVFNGLALNATGNWVFCVGDAAGGDTGELCSADLSINQSGGSGGSGIASIVDAMASNDCTSTFVSFTLVTNGGSTGADIDVVVFDDQQEKYRQTVSVPAGNNSQSISFSYPDTSVGTGAPGIGLILYDSQGMQLDGIDPLFVDKDPSCGANNPVVTLTLNPNPVPARQPFTIGWSATNATGINPCTAALGGPTGWSQTQFRPSSGQETYVVDTPGVIDFAMQCESAAGLIGDANVSLTVIEIADALPVPIISRFGLLLIGLLVVIGGVGLLRWRH